MVLVDAAWVIETPLYVTVDGVPEDNLKPTKSMFAPVQSTAYVNDVAVVELFAPFT